MTTPTGEARGHGLALLGSHRSDDPGDRGRDPRIPELGSRVVEVRRGLGVLLLGDATAAFGHVEVGRRQQLGGAEGLLPRQVGARVLQRGIGRGQGGLGLVAARRQLAGLQLGEELTASDPVPICTWSLATTPETRDPTFTSAPMRGFTMPVAFTEDPIVRRVTRTTSPPGAGSCPRLAAARPRKARGTATTPTARPHASFFISMAKMRLGAFALIAGM